MRVRCAEVSRELEEPLAATASVAARWELVEREKPWGRDHGLVAEGAKVLLIHRLGDEPAAGRKYLVCTNGARDPCCAIRGPAVAHALERARTGQVYECSHLGGHRFAANVLVLPDGLCFGRLDVRSALALVDELDAGRLPLDHFRGRTAYEPAQQAAEILVRRELGVDGLNDVSVGADLTASVRGVAYRVTLRRTELPPRRVSCRDDKIEQPTAWSLENLLLA